MEARFDIVVNLCWRVFQFTLAVLFANILIYLIMALSQQMVGF